MNVAPDESLHPKIGITFATLVNMPKGKAIIFSAPSGAGKTTLVRHIVGMEDFNLSFSVSATSRQKREHEIEGTDYHFISVAEFKQKVVAEEFLEWQEVYKDQFYGTLKSEIEKIWVSGRNVIFDVDVVGGINLKKIIGGKALAIFLQPPSIEALQLRLRNRSTETTEKIAMRIAKAKNELTFSNQFDVIIVNDVLAVAQEETEKKIREFLKFE